MRRACLVTELASLLEVEDFWFHEVFVAPITVENREVNYILHFIGLSDVENGSRSFSGKENSLQIVKFWRTKIIKIMPKIMDCCYIFHGMKPSRD